MDEVCAVLKKKLNAYRRPKGSFQAVKSDILVELLRVWEKHTGPSYQMAQKLGMHPKQLGRLIQQARKVVREHAVDDQTFQEIALDAALPVNQSGSGIEVVWDKGRIIRLPNTDVLVDFLRKAG
jgi:hypothetical protein